MALRLWAAPVRRIVIPERRVASRLGALGPALTAPSPAAASPARVAFTAPCHSPSPAIGFSRGLASRPAHRFHPTSSSRMAASNGHVSANANDYVTNWTLGKVLDSIPKPATSAASSPLAFLHIISRLKTTPREGWKRFGINDGESIADHMYRMGVIAMLCPPEENIDKDKAVKIALVHDMAEALVGDITPVDNIPKEEKYQREWDSMKYICDELLKPISETIAKEFLDLWSEYEAGQSKEAIFVKDVDCFELICQTIEYEKKYEAEKDIREFYHVRHRIKNDFVKKWVEDVLTERTAFWTGLGKEEMIPLPH